MQEWFKKLYGYQKENRNFKNIVYIQFIVLLQYLYIIICCEEDWLQRQSDRIEWEREQQMYIQKMGEKQKEYGQVVGLVGETLLLKILFILGIGFRKILIWLRIFFCLLVFIVVGSFGRDTRFEVFFKVRICMLQY